MLLRILLLLPLVALISACNGGGGGSSGGTDVQKDLGKVFNQALKTTPVVSLTLLREDGTPIENADIEVIKQEGSLRIRAGSGTTDAAGAVSLGLAKDTYELRINGVGDVADYTGALAVSGDPVQAYTLQTQLHTFNLDAGAELLDETFLSVYQLDQNGLPDDRVSRTGNGPGLASATDTLSVEIFPGSYLATAYANKDAGGSTPTVKTSTISAVAAATGTTAIDLSGAGFVLDMTLNDVSAAPITAGYQLTAYDTTTFLRIDRITTDGAGLGSLLVGSDMSVAVLIHDDNGDVVGMHNFGAVTADQSVTRQMHTVTGSVVPVTGSLVADDQAEVSIGLSSDLALQLDEMAGADIDRRIDMTPTTGEYSVDLFDGPFSFGADDVENFPTVTERAVTVAGADLADQNISVGPGGLIRGTILTVAGAPVVDVRVSVYPAGVLSNPDLRRVDRERTDGFGVYAMGLPYGEYDVVVEGAVTESITVSEKNPDQIIDLTQYALTGRVTDANDQGVAAEVDVLGGDSSLSDGLGVYTVNVIEGINQICFTPLNDSSLGYSCETNVLVDADTVAKYKP